MQSNTLKAILIAGYLLLTAACSAQTGFTALITDEKGVATTGLRLRGG